MLIVEDLLLLLTDDATGKHVVDSTRLDLGLAGACVVELAILGRVDIAGTGDAAKPGRLVVRDSAPVGEAILDRALGRCADAEGKKPEAVLDKVKSGLRDEVLRSLEAQGVLRVERSKLLGIFPVTRWPAADQAHEARVRDRLMAVLLDGLTPDDRSAALIALLSAVDAVPTVMATSGREIDRRLIKRRAKEIQQSEWGAKAVASAVAAVEAAVMAAVMVATTTAATSGSS